MIYQLIGPKYLKPGQYVDMGYPGERWGVIASVIQEDYALPNPCMVTGTRKFTPQPVTLFSIHGCAQRHEVDPKTVPCVWGWNA